MFFKGGMNIGLFLGKGRYRLREVERLSSQGISRIEDKGGI